MKKINSKKMKIIWGSLGAAALMVPTIAVSAVACSNQNSSTQTKINITSQPENQVAVVGQTANMPTFFLKVGSLPDVKLNYQWYSNTKNSTEGATKIDGATTNAYTVTTDNVKTAGTTYFFVEIGGTENGNNLKTITSNIVSLTVNTLPLIVIKNQPIANQVAIAGQTQNLPSLSVNVANISGATLNYQWYKSNSNSTTDGNEIPGATNSSYIIPSSDLTTEIKKYYFVKISGTLNGAALAPVSSIISTLTVSAAPKITITTQPNSQKATIGETENLPSFSVAVNNIEGAQLTYQWYSNTNNSNENGTAIEGATSMTYTVKSSDIGNNATTKYYYVIVSGTLNGVALTPVDSNAASLTVAAKPTDAQIANALATAINTLSPNVANFAATQQMQYMAPSYAAGKMLPQIQALIQNLIEKNPSEFNNLEVNGTPIKINPNLVTVYSSQVSSNEVNNSKTAQTSLSVAINYGNATEANSNPASVEVSQSSNVNLDGFNGFTDEQKTKIATWFNQPTIQEALMKNLLSTQQGKTFLMNLLGQTFFKFVIKGLENNFELQSVVLNNNLTFANISGEYSAFVVSIKTTAEAQYSSTPESGNVFTGFSNFKSIPSGSIISFQLPLTFALPSTTVNNANIYQPNYVLSSTYTNTTDANPSWVLMNGFNQFNPEVTWTLPPYKQGWYAYPSSAGNVGVLGINSSSSYPYNSYTLNINRPNNTILVSGANLFFRFAQNSSQTAYNSDGQEISQGLTYIQMPKFSAASDSAQSVFNNLFQEILTVIK